MMPDPRSAADTPTSEDAGWRRRPHVSLHIVRKTGAKSGGKILLTERKWRSKYATIVCFCKRRRKNGSCIYTDALTPLLIHPERSKLLHPEIDEQRFPAPVVSVVRDHQGGTA